MKVIIYLSNWNLLGGVETFTKNFCKRMSKHHNVTLLYDNVASPHLITEMQKYCSVEKVNFKHRYKCDVFISASAWGKSVFDVIDSKVYIQTVHADYRLIISGWAFKYKKHPKVTHHVCVGEIVKEGFEISTGLKCDAVIYNLLDNTQKYAPKKKNKILSLITCSRLSGEKGFNRMHTMAKQMDSLRIDYVWNIFGDDSHAFGKQLLKQFADCPKVHFNGITTEPFKEINKADYLVQLSDTEGFAYSVYEAMQVKTPCIITPFASGKEQITHGINGYIVPFDMNGIDYVEIQKRSLKVPEFEELGKEEHWISFFDSAMKWHSENMVTIRIIATVQVYKVGEIVDLPKERALSAIERGLAVLIEKPIG